MSSKFISYHLFANKKNMQNHYKLLTPGPLTTSATVKETMLRDWCTWDRDYNDIVQDIRKSLLQLADADPITYSTVLMQGSGTFSVESAIGTLIPKEGKLLVLANGAYGQRIATIAQYLNINLTVHDFGETHPVDPEITSKLLQQDKTITHVAFVHCETTTGMLNPIEAIIPVIKEHGKTCILDAMSSFGGIPISLSKLDIDALISSANKCIQGVPGFGFVIIKRSLIQACKGRARSLSLDLFDQWQTMETQNGKWRYTSPTHTVRAFKQAILELVEEGGIEKRYERYRTSQQLLVKGMQALGYSTLLQYEYHSPIITTFLSPEHPDFTFQSFYNALKDHGFVIYPGKVTNFECFRIGNIGEIYPGDIELLLKAVASVSDGFKSLNYV